MRHYSREDQRLLATWALDCAERVMPLFLAVAPADPRPGDAIETGRQWVITGIFSMPVIRRASLDAHAAAKAVTKGSAAAHAAHAAGQAVATAHVTQHAYGGAYYALRALAESRADDAVDRVLAEQERQRAALPEHLRAEVADRFSVLVERGRVKVTLTKGPGF